MKYFSIIMLLMVGFLNLYSQKVEEKILHKEFSSRDLSRGGDYPLITSSLGELKAIDHVIVYLKSDGTPYTVSNTDSVLVKIRDFTGKNLSSLYIKDEFFTQSVSTGSSTSSGLPKSAPGNSYNLVIPSGKFSGSTSPLIISIFYREIKY